MGKPVNSPYLLNLLMNNVVGAEEYIREQGSVLTPREKEVLQYLIEGNGNKEIADRLCVSPETIKSHIKNIYRKLNVTNRIEAVKVIMEQNLL